MRHDQALNEIYLAPEPDRPDQQAVPALYLIPGGGEGAGPDDGMAPELSLVPDSDPVADPVAELSAAPIDTGPEPDSPAAGPTSGIETAIVLRLETRRHGVAKHVGFHALGGDTLKSGPARSSRSLTAEEVYEMYSDKEEYRKKGGGGRWLLEEHRKKQAAEAKERAEAESLSHPEGCNCEPCESRR